MQRVGFQLLNINTDLRFTAFLQLVYRVLDKLAPIKETIKRERERKQEAKL